jgi:hypothetical protein
VTGALATVALEITCAAPDVVLDPQPVTPAINTEANSSVVIPRIFLMADPRPR